MGGIVDYAGWTLHNRCTTEEDLQEPSPQKILNSPLSKSSLWMPRTVDRFLKEFDLFLEPVQHEVLLTLTVQ